MLATLCEISWKIFFEILVPACCFWGVGLESCALEHLFGVFCVEFVFYSSLWHFPYVIVRLDPRWNYSFQVVCVVSALAIFVGGVSFVWV